MSRRTLAVEPLTKAAFARFGDVIETGGAVVRSINQGFAKRFHDLARIDVAASGGTAIVSIFTATIRPRPIAIDMLERHPLGSQAFVPLSADPWLAVVAEGGDEPDLATLRCFRVAAEQGVNYARGVWHFPLLTLVGEQSFLVVDRDGPGENLDERVFADADITQISPD